MHTYVSGGYTYPGTYWIGGTNCYSAAFDFDGNGSIDVSKAVNVQLAGLELSDALAVDKIFNGGAGIIGRSGIMNVAPSTDYCYIYFYVGTGF